ncbi:MAG: L-serine ammonia-lyase, iron-sulfur-dependent, subunit alpha [Spirochaetaceae bacterium]|nr:L-serine ammonia-lyase, iron-sulfur-dependent, subunit alpha [Spirochaetaceae bacterium]
MINYNSISQLAKTANEQKVTISQVVLNDQAKELGLSEEQLFKQMEEMLDVMIASVKAGMNKDTRSSSGLTGGNAYKVNQYSSAGKTIGGSFCTKAIAKAIAVAEYNASMGKIVAAPTAGACGIIPAALLTMMEEHGIEKKAAVMALITAGAIGMVIANEASISGAKGGCQAECGSAAAMAAGAMVEMFGGTNDMVADSCAIAIKNQLGLVCDPVAGLVEVPCVKRNAGGIMCAICAADIALAGVKSVIPVDEVVTAMREVGESISADLRETARGGLATTPTGIMLKEKIFGK